MDNLIKEEKEKENQRVKEYEKATSAKEKQLLEKENAKSRAEGNQKVTLKQRVINKKVSDYEKELKNNNNTNNTTQNV